MQSTMDAPMEMAELDQLVAHLDTRIGETEAGQANDGASFVLCSLGCGGGGGGGYSWYWSC